MKLFSLQKIFPYYYGWLILSVTALAMFFSGPGQTYAISIFLEPMRKSLNLSLSEIASLYTLGSLSAAVFLVFIGQYSIFLVYCFDLKNTDVGTA